MANVTLFVPDDLKARMDLHKQMRWSRAIRQTIESKLDDFEEAEKLARKSLLTEKDVKKFSSKVDEKLAKRAEALLNETRR